MRSKRLSLGLACCTGYVCFGTLTTTTRAAAPDDTLLYGFTASYNISEGPYAGVIEDSSGNLYGTTSGGGTDGKGTVFQLVPPSGSGGAWTENVLYSFTGLTDGGAPVGGLTFDSAGNLYGTTLPGWKFHLCRYSVPFDNSSIAERGQTVGIREVVQYLFSSRRRRRRRFKPEHCA